MEINLQLQNSIYNNNCIFFSFSQLGIAVGFLLPPILVENHTDLDLVGDDLKLMFYIVAGFTSLLVILVLICKYPCHLRSIFFTLICPPNSFQGGSTNAALGRPGGNQDAQPAPIIAIPALHQATNAEPELRPAVGVLWHERRCVLCHLNPSESG